MKDYGRPSLLACKLCDEKFEGIALLGEHAWKAHRKRLINKRVQKFRKRAEKAAAQKNGERSVTLARMSGARFLRGGAPGSKR